MTAGIQTHVDRIVYAGLLAALLTATVVDVAHHGGLGAALAGGLGPDLALLLGAGAGLAAGQIHPRAVPVYNAVHRFWGPAALVAVALAGPAGHLWLGGCPAFGAPGCV